MLIYDIQNYVPQNTVYMLNEEIKSLDDKQKAQILMYKFKNPTICLILSIFLGIFGVDRFYLEDFLIGGIKAGLMCMLTFFGAISEEIGENDVLDIIIGFIFIAMIVFWFIDIFLCFIRCKDKNYQKIMEILNYLKRK
ncbi:TM2 domain-containing protein [Campylobacter ureolyticus]|uniref:TM2 domain-containing protein n=1 Tax=Campylobacter ureolyticus TaxID=827 RepID=UPI0022B44E16|nr:TM2 domain-containing protein [Campylobacter ureolyticus]MCZ6133113.1 TM2 domain-containing protein [Campylobacter ureolyticus]